MSYSLFKPTINATGFDTEDFKRIKIGQWVSVFGAKGQYLGITRAGVVTINYNKVPDMQRQFIVSCHDRGNPINVEVTAKSAQGAAKVYKLWYLSTFNEIIACRGWPTNNQWRFETYDYEQGLGFVIWVKEQ